MHTNNINGLVTFVVSSESKKWETLEHFKMKVTEDLYSDNRFTVLFQHKPYEQVPELIKHLNRNHLYCPFS